jgi:hypothetical protein
MTIKLIGSDAQQSTNDLSSGRVRYFKYTADASGTVSEIKIYALANGNVKIAIYADSSGDPGSRLAYNDSGQAVTADQWNTLSIDGLSVTQSTVYWLACIYDTTGSLAYDTIGAGHTPVRYKTATYSTFTWPSSADWTSSNDLNDYSIAGWGISGGWTNIAKINGVTATDLAKVDGVAVADIAKISGITV